jgi:hypothetical protein
MREAIKVLVNESTNLPMAVTYQQGAVEEATATLATTISIINEANHNLSKPEKELLHWHH